MSEQIKLNLGCGVRKLDGFVNVDAAPEREPDVVADVLSLPFPDNHADVIYAGHILEHIRPRQIFSALREWKRVLKPGGAIYISIPDFVKAWSMHMSRDINWEIVNAIILGSDEFTGENDRAYHKQLVSEEHTAPFIHTVFGNVEVLGNECEYAAANPLWQTVFKAVKLG